MKAAPLNWIRQLDELLAELDQKPQFGLSSPFDWPKMEKALQKLFDRPDLTLSHKINGWGTKEQVQEGLEGELCPLTLEFAPISSPFFFVTDAQSLKGLMGTLFHSPEAATFFFDPSHVEGFYAYFATEVLHAIGKQEFVSGLTPRLVSQNGAFQSMLKEQACFFIDLTLTIGESSYWGRLLLPENFREDWKSYQVDHEPPSLTKGVRERIKVDVGLEVGHTRLGWNDWKEAKKGDFILLDHCSYDPDTHSGGVVLTFKQNPLFRGRFKETGINITNYPIYEEVSGSMRDEDEDEYEEDYEDEDEEEDEDYEDEEEDEAEEEAEDDFFEGFDEEPQEREEQGESTVHAEMAPQESSRISPEELPLQLTIEVGRVRMSAQELMNLAPGNLLELNVAPERGVDLVISGKRVGRGELIRMGDVLGVRILSL